MVLTTPREHKQRQNGDPLAIEGTVCFPNGISWSVRDGMDLCGAVSPRPHSIVCIIADIPATEASQCLTLHEVRAIIHLMLPRVSRECFKDALVHPVSLFCPFHFMVITLTISSCYSFHTWVQSMAGSLKPPMMAVNLPCNTLNCGASKRMLRHRLNCLFATI